MIYEIYIKSFNDSSGNGIGDLKGIVEKLDYLSTLGIEYIWITPFYPSNQIDNGYDVIDYIDINPEYGDFNDFSLLISEAKKKNIKIMIDLVFSHTSDYHEWFINSKKRINKYEDYYVWSDKPLNNWESMFGGSVWQYCKERNQYYLHRFAIQQPDLNLSNPLVIEEHKKTLDFWYNKGVRGFRFDVANFYFTDLSKLIIDNPKDEHINDINHQGAIDVIQQLKKHVLGYKQDVLFVGEIGSEEVSELATYVGDDKMDLVFNFNLSSIKTLDVPLLVEKLNEIKNFPNPTIFFSSHDMSRFFTRLAQGNENLQKLLLELILFFPATPVLFQGDEYGAADYQAKKLEDIYDIQAKNKIKENSTFDEIIKESRDFSRTPMKFNSQEKAGFTNASPWLPIVEGNNIKDSLLDTNSILSKYLELVKERKELITNTNRRVYEIILDNEIVIIKIKACKIKYLLFNFTKNKKQVNLENEMYVLAPFSSRKVLNEKM